MKDIYKQLGGGVNRMVTIWDEIFINIKIWGYDKNTLAKETEQANMAKY